MINIEDSQYLGIEKEKINDLPLFTYEGPIRVIRNVEEAFEAVELLTKESVLGFDTESRPAFKKGISHLPSLVQLAGREIVYIFQIGVMKTIEPLLDLFKDDKVIKAGVAIHDDLIRLKSFDAFFESGFVEITKLTEQAGITNRGLRGLTAYLLGVRVSKRMQISNWAQDELSEPQISYAATDAWVSRQLYMKLINKYNAK